MSGYLNEIRFAWRGLARSPGFTAVAVITLALGIGATTSVFTLVDAVLLRALPYPESDELLSLQHVGRGGEDELPVSTGLYVLYEEHARSLASIALHQNAVANVTGEGEPERVEGQQATASLFDVLRVAPALGRPLLPSDAVEGAEPVVVLSDALWRSRFGGAASSLDETVVMDGVTRRVVGVMPRGFAYPTEEVRFWIPMVVNPVTAPIGNFSASGIARMREGVGVEAVQADLQGIITRLDELAPEAAQTVAFLREVNLTARVMTMKDAVVGDLGRTLWTLLGMVAFVLLIACANVANLLLVRAEGRQRELALRMALGAGRSALIRPFLAESLGLAMAGGALGVAVAAVAVRTTTALAPADLPRMGEVGVDVRVLAFTAVIALTSALFFGLFPALRFGRTNLSGALKEGGSRGGTTGRERHRVRTGLVVVQVTLALVLLVGSGLMFRSFLALLAVDPGFDQAGVLTVRLTVPPGEIAEPAGVAEFYRQLRERLAAQPGVEAVGSVSAVPLSGLGLSFGGHAIEDHPTAPDEMPPMAFQTFMDPGYFDAMGIPLVEGRSLQTGDAGDRFRGAVVSRAYAERWWPGSSAVGRRFNWGGGDWWEIVGVAENVRTRGLQEDPEEMIYLPTTFGAAEQPIAARTRDVVVRVASDPAGFLPVLRREIRELNPRIPLANPRTMADVLRASAAQTSFTMAVLGSASVVALLLGLIGIYGVVSYVVTQRTREIGVRMALGATGASVRRMVVRQGLGLAGMGVGVGLVVALSASRVIDSLLYGVSSRDPLTYGAVALSLAAVAVLASWIPARRAAGVDPATALRRE